MSLIVAGTISILTLGVGYFWYKKKENCGTIKPGLPRCRDLMDDLDEKERTFLQNAITNKVTASKGLSDELEKILDDLHEQVKIENLTGSSNYFDPK